LNANKPNIIFAGTPEFAAIHLKALIDAQVPIKAVYTQPDRRAGRGKKISSSAVKQLALEHNICVYQPESLKDEQSQQQLKALQPDLMIVVAYGLILPQQVLNIPQLGCINIHGSLLPRWRGAAPIQRAIAAGDTHTGVCIMQLEQGLDTGPILAHQSLPILPIDTAGSLHDKMAEHGAKLLLENLKAILQHQLVAVAQDSSKACYAEKLLKPEAEINWNQTAQRLSLLIRAFNPWPVCFFRLGANNIRVWSAQQVIHSNSTHQNPGTINAVNKDSIDVNTGEGLLRITKMQIPGKKPMSVADILRGQPHLFEKDIQL